MSAPASAGQQKNRRPVLIGTPVFRFIEKEVKISWWAQSPIKKEKRKCDSLKDAAFKLKGDAKRQKPNIYERRGDRRGRYRFAFLMLL
ncbi:MAG: hypothetical protein J6L81_05715 [Clostridia bacterium]|nr:hypothetical protein [Clostridia bacterium]